LHFTPHPISIDYKQKEDLRMSHDPQTPGGQLTSVLDQVSGGRSGAFAELIELVYSDLHGLACKRLNERDAPDTIQATELVNETVRLLLQQRQGWENRDHFFAIATRLMLRVIVDRQRRRMASKRGGGAQAAPLEEAELASLATDPGFDDEDTSRLVSALAALHESQPRAAEVVTLHIVGDFTLPRVAELLDVSLATVERDWRAAKEHLLKAVEG